MPNSFLFSLSEQLDAIRAKGLYKEERVITSPQSASVALTSGKKVLNFCSNNYLGLADHPAIKEAAIEAIRSHGFGMASVRFICGTQDLHIELEQQLSHFLGTEATILYSSCFDANGGLFETLLTAEDGVISDSLNHASIIDGIRLSKAQRFRYQNNDMADLEAKLQEAKGCRFRLIATDGAFSMDGSIANLPVICQLAKKYDALVMIDDCHATGFLGKEGGGCPDYWNLRGQVDIITGTFGKALGGASGGFISGRKEVIALLRQRSRPYLFSNAVAPPIVAATLAALELLKKEGETLRTKLFENAAFFRREMTQLGFTLLGEAHPIIPILLKEAKLTQLFAAKMLEEGIYVVGFFYPVVPENQARIRTQMCALHSRSDLERAVNAFAKVGRELKVI